MLDADLTAEFGMPEASISTARVSNAAGDGVTVTLQVGGDSRRWGIVLPKSVSDPRWAFPFLKAVIARDAGQA